MTLSISDFNGFDYLICGIFALFIMLSLWRGLIKELISIGAWVIGLLMAIVFTPKLAALLTDSPTIQAMLTHAGSKMSESTASESHLIIGFCFLLLLLVVLILGSIVNFMMTKVVEAAGLGFMNRLMGGIFGFIKGFFVNLALIFYLQTTSFAQTPTWEQSQLAQAYQPAVALVQERVGSGFVDLDETIKQMLDRAG